MSSHRSQGVTAAYLYLPEVPVIFLPLLTLATWIVAVYRWHRVQYCSLRNSIDLAMETTSAMLASRATNTSFTKFGQLPPELRISIWQCAMPDARTIVVKSPYTRRRTEARSLEEALAADPDTEETWSSSARIPALLHVNAEARHEALKLYRLGLAVGMANPRIYVDFSRDTLFFGHEELKPECASLWAATPDLQGRQTVDGLLRLAVVPEGAWRVLRYGKVDLDGIKKITFVHGVDDMGFRLGKDPQLVEDVGCDLLEALQEDAQVRQLRREAEGEGGSGEIITGEADQPQEPQLHEPQEYNVDETPSPDSAAETTDSATTEESEGSTALTTHPVYGPMKKRMQAARQELDTLSKVLPTAWTKEPVVATAMFKKSPGDWWIP